MSKPASSLGALSVFVKWLVIGLALAYIGEKTAGLKTLPFAVGSALYNVLIVFDYWAALLRPGFALCALWEAANVLARLAKGDAFGPAMVKGMRGIGLNLIMGAVAALVLVPLFAYLAYAQSPAQVYGPGIESITFGLIGIVLYVLAAQGQKLRDKMESFV